jgi:hypothetical protein
MSGNTINGGLALHWRFLIAPALLTAKAGGMTSFPARETNDRSELTPWKN